MKKETLISISSEKIDGNNLLSSIFYFFKKTYFRKGTTIGLLSFNLFILIEFIIFLFFNEVPSNGYLMLTDDTLSLFLTIITYSVFFTLFINSITTFKLIKDSIIYQKIISSEYSEKDFLLSFSIVNYLHLLCIGVILISPLLIEVIIMSGFNLKNLMITIGMFFAFVTFIAICSLLSTSLSVVMSSTKFSTGVVIIIFILLFMFPYIFDLIWNKLVILMKNLGFNVSDNWFNSFNEIGHLNFIGYIRILILIFISPMQLPLAITTVLYNGTSLTLLIYVAIPTILIWILESIAFFYLAIYFLKRGKR